MTKFSLEIVADDDKVKINLPGERTFGITSTSSGAAFIPDWSNRHFTWAADETTGAPFHHVTDETRDEKIVKVSTVPRTSTCSGCTARTARSAS